MTAFRSRWDEWAPKVPTPRTDKTDKRASVSFVSASPRHIPPLEGEGASQKSPNAHTDKTDKRCPVVRPPGQPGAHAVLLQGPDGVPDAWVQGVADLLAMPPHPDWPEPRWRTLQEDTLAFLGEWACQAHRLGWDTPDLFGVHNEAPHARFDGMGLVPLLDGRPIVAITKDSAVITVASGGVQIYRRRATWPEGCCLIWELGI